MTDLKAQVKKLEEQLKPKSGLFSKNPLEVRVQAAKGFGELKIPKGHPVGLEVVEQLRNSASKDEPEKEVRKEAIIAISKIGIVDKSLSIFMSDLATLDAEAEIRMEASRALGTWKMDTERDIEKYQLKALRTASEKDANKLVRCAALDAMLSIKSVAATDKVIKELLHLIEKESEGVVRQRICHIFGVFGEENPSIVGDDVVNSLLSAIGRDYFEDVRNEATEALSKLSTSGGRGEDLMSNFAETLSKCKVKNERKRLCTALNKILSSNAKAIGQINGGAAEKLKEANKAEADEDLTKVVAMLK